MALVSFLIAYHNEPLSLLRKSIESILSIGLDDNEREIIVVDDGSNSSPEPLLKSLCNGIRLIRQENQGLSMARNNALEAATGEYIQFVDSDDSLVSSVYRKVIEKVKEKRMDMLMFKFTTDEKHHPSTQELSLSECRSGVEQLLNKNLRAAACAYIFRKDVLGDLRFRQGIYHEDVLFTPMLILQSKTLYETDQKAYFYRQQEGSITSNRDARHIQKRLNDYLSILSELQLVCSSLEGRKRLAMQRCVAQLTMNHLYIVITQTHSLHEYFVHKKQLKAKGLCPLPLKMYTWKYLLFAIATRIA